LRFRCCKPGYSAANDDAPQPRRQATSVNTGDTSTGRRTQSAAHRNGERTAWCPGLPSRSLRSRAGAAGASRVRKRLRLPDRAAHPGVGAAFFGLCASKPTHRSPAASTCWLTASPITFSCLWLLHRLRRWFRSGQRIPLAQWPLSAVASAGLAPANPQLMATIRGWQEEVKAGRESRPQPIDTGSWRISSRKAEQAGAIRIFASLGRVSPSQAAQGRPKLPQMSTIIHRRHQRTSPLALALLVSWPAAPGRLHPLAPTSESAALHGTQSKPAFRITTAFSSPSRRLPRLVIYFRCGCLQFCGAWSIQSFRLFPRQCRACFSFKG